MSNNAKRPRGYTDRKAQDIQQEYQMLAAQLGQALLAEKAAKRDQDEFIDRGLGLIDQFNYAKRQEGTTSLAPAGTVATDSAPAGAGESTQEAAPAS